jgi:hypothetical protein
MLTPRAEMSIYPRDLIFFRIEDDPAGDSGAAKLHSARSVSGSTGRNLPTFIYSFFLNRLDTL